MSITIVDNESGKAYECVDWRCGKAGETFLPRRGPLWTLEHDSGYERHILKEIPNPYVKRSDVDELVAAARELVGWCRGYFRPEIGSKSAPRTYVEDCAAALEPFTQPSPPEVRGRFFYMEPCAYIEDRETTRRYDLTDYKQVIELNDLLNTLSKSQGES